MHATHDTGDSANPTWTVYRQDETGNRFVVADRLTGGDAMLAVAEFEARGHKQTYWAEPDPPSPKGDPVTSILLAALLSPSFPAEPFRPAGPPYAGKWTVTFANDVVETVELTADGSASVVEPNRRSVGKARFGDDSLVIPFEDDRTERWTRVGDRMVVEHWFPSAQFPNGRPVRGIAERSR